MSSSPGDNGKAAFCEKPLAVSLAASERAGQAGRRSKHRRAAIKLSLRLGTGPRRGTDRGQWAGGFASATVRARRTSPPPSPPGRGPWQQAGPALWARRRREEGRPFVARGRLAFHLPDPAHRRSTCGRRRPASPIPPTAETGGRRRSRPISTAGKVEIGLNRARSARRRADDSNSLQP